MSMACTPTPSTSTRGGSLRSGWLGDLKLLVDPAVGEGEAVLKHGCWLPSEHLSQQAVVGIAAAHTLRSVDVLEADVGLTGNFRDDPRKLIDAHHPVGSQVQRVGVAGLHQAVNALDAVIDIAERTGLLAVTPDLDLPALFRRSNLAADGGRGLLPSAVVGAVGAVDVVEADRPRHEPVLLSVVLAELLGDQLLPPVCVLRVGGIGVRPVSYTHLRAHETDSYLVCRL